MSVCEEVGRGGGGSGIHACVCECEHVSALKKNQASHCVYLCLYVYVFVLGCCVCVIVSVHACAHVCVHDCIGVGAWVFGCMCVLMLLTSTGLDILQSSRIIRQ